MALVDGVYKYKDSDGAYTATQAAGTVNDIYAYTKDFNDVTDFNLMRGVPDFGNLMQFTPYESGYAVFIICSIPKFMEKLAEYNAKNIVVDIFCKIFQRCFIAQILTLCI